MPKNSAVRYDVSLFNDHDIYLFKEGNHFNLHMKLGAHLLSIRGLEGTYFAVWAPNGEKVSVIGEFNGWNKDFHPLQARWDGSGIWEGFIPGIGPGTLYKNTTLNPGTTATGWTKGTPWPFAGNARPGLLPWYGTWIMNGEIGNGCKAGIGPMPWRRPSLFMKYTPVPGGESRRREIVF